MEDQELKNAIESILEDTFKEISNAYKWQKEIGGNDNSAAGSGKSLIVFPNYNDIPEDPLRESDIKNYTRVSEQELRFIFVEKFNEYFKNNNNKLYFYSIETPTRKSYVFDENQSGPKVEDNGVSARIDLVIMTKDAGEFKRVALIEFKAHNPDVNDYRKDICKLINEEWEDNPNCLKYFIQIINVNNEHRTWGNIKNKKITAIDALREEDKGDKEKEKRKKDIKYSIEYKCFNLNSKNIMYGIIKNDTLENIDYDTIDTECKSLSTAE